MKKTIFMVQLMIGTAGYAQVTDSVEARESTVNSLRDLFMKGQFSGIVRNSFMATINEADLKDYWANGTGGSLYYHTASFKGFQIGVGGLFAFNTGSSDLTETDPLVGKGSRWEIQLFDITDPGNKYDMDRLEELFLMYHYKKSWLIFGKIGINTPLVNKQDSRLKPTALSGLWTELNEWKKISINAGWFTKTSPRSTTKWYSLEDAIGIYGRGVNIDGTSSGYAGNLKTKGMGIFGIKYKIRDRVKIQIWDYYIDNILNAGFIQTDYSYDQYELGIQYLREDKVGQGGNADPVKTYFPSGHTTNLFSLKAGLKRNKWKASMNYTQALNTGRFLFPRELGTARIYTFISRHRVEGLGGFQTLMMKFNYYPLNDKSLDAGIYIGHTNSHGINDFELNKYGFVSFNQLNVDIKYQLKGWFEGLDIRGLYVLGKSFNDSVEDPAYIFNKTNLSHMNVVATLNF